MSNNVKIKLLSKHALIPKYQTQGSAGFDLHSIEECVLKPDETKAISTGLAFELPDNLELQIRSRSGMSLLHNVFVLNSPGTVDSDYRGEVKIILKNSGKTDYSIKIGDRIAQGVIANYVKIEEFEIADTLQETPRAERGFGSTGS